MYEKKPGLRKWRVTPYWRNALRRNEWKERRAHSGRYLRLEQWRAEQIVEKAHVVLEEFGFSAESIQIGARSVGVMGDARTYLPCVVITLKKSVAKTEELQKVSTELINRIPHINRVMYEPLLSTDENDT